MTKKVESLDKQMKNKVDSKKLTEEVNEVEKKINTEVKNLQKDIK